MTRIGVGVVGIGFGQQAHIPAFRSQADCDVVALCAGSLERAKTAAERLRVPKAYGNWKDLLDDPNVNAVSIAVPPSISPDIAIAALESGKAVFSEKPIAASLSKARAVCDAAEKAKVANMVDFELPEIPEWRAARNHLKEGLLGRLRHVSVSWNVETYANRKHLKSWKTSAQEGGGVLFGFGSHVFHYLEWLLEPIKGLSARLSRAPGDSRSADTFAALCIECASGLPVSVQLSNNAFLGSGHRIEIFGDEGTLMLDNPGKDHARGFRILHGRRGEIELASLNSGSDMPWPEGDGRIAMVSRLAERFVSWIKTGAKSGPTLAEGLRVQRLLAAARESHEGCRWIEGLND